MQEAEFTWPVNASADVVCVGDLMVEYMLRIPTLPAADTTLVLNAMRKEVGGAAFNISYYLSLLGVPVRLVATYGERDHHLIGDAFRSAKLEQGNLIRIPGDNDVLIALLTERHHHSVYVRAHMPDDIEEDIVRRSNEANWLILAGSRHAAVRRAFVDLATSFQGDFMAFNPSYAIYEYQPSELESLLRRADAVLLNEQEANHALSLLGLRSEAELAQVAPQILIITLGRIGLRLYRSSQRRDFENVSPSPQNAIGAGDAFFAGFLIERFRGGSELTAIDFGSALAARVVESSKIRLEVSEMGLSRAPQTRP